MAAIERFEDSTRWKESRVLAREIYRVTRQGEFARDFGLRDQIRRAAVSVVSNVAEGFERGSDKDFRRFLNIAKASAGEVRSLLVVADDVGYLAAERCGELTESVTRVSRRIGGFINYLDRGIETKKES